MKRARLLPLGMMMIMMATWDPACDDELRIETCDDELWGQTVLVVSSHPNLAGYHLRPRGMMSFEKYEKYDFQPLVRVGYQGMQKRYETKISNFWPIASGHNLRVVF